MKCAYCKQSTRSSSAYVCDECQLRVQATNDAIEARARAVAYTDCPAQPGQPCLTGSGTPRGIAHAVRVKLGSKEASRG
jgi:hypothetical protein